MIGGRRVGERRARRGRINNCPGRAGQTMDGETDGSARGGTHRGLRGGFRRGRGGVAAAVYRLLQSLHERGLEAVARERSLFKLLL
eukprot:30753-Pelagococcus_subviridis.AAC.1